MFNYKFFDIGLLILTVIALSIFVYKKRDKISIDGPMYLYRTKIGMKLIDWFGKKHAKFLDIMLWPLLITSYGLMIFGVVYFLFIIFQYLTDPIIVELVKAPPILPIFPYFTEFFGLNSFFPNFYFISFIISVGIAIVVHEFSHGIYAKRFGIGIKSTGFALLRLFKIPLPFFGAFVEQDDKQMVKAPKKAQLTILGAGVFSNMIVTVLSIGLLWLFFLASFQPAGIVFNDYAITTINYSEVQTINDFSVYNFNAEDLAMLNQSEYVRLGVHDIYFYTSTYAINRTFNSNIELLNAYEDAPAFNAKLKGLITNIDGKKITSRDGLSIAIKSHQPGDKIQIETLYNNQKLNYDLTLANRSGVAYLGISSSSSSPASPLKKIIYYLSMVTPKKINYSTGVVYQSKIGSFGIFLFDMIWWVILINFAVAICNMLPIGIFDGGRFFMLSVWGITGKKKFAESSFKWVTIFFLVLLAIWMVKWFSSYFF